MLESSTHASDEIDTKEIGIQILVPGKHDCPHSTDDTAHQKPDTVFGSHLEHRQEKLKTLLRRQSLEWSVRRINLDLGRTV